MQLLLHKSNIGFFDIDSPLIRANWRQTAAANRRLHSAEFRAAKFDRSIARSHHFEEDKCMHFTRACTRRHVRATRARGRFHLITASSELSRPLKEINCSTDVHASGFDRIHDGSSRISDGKKYRRRRKNVLAQTGIFCEIRKTNFE